MSTVGGGRLLISHITLRGPELAQAYGLIVARHEVSGDDIVAALCPAAGTSPFALADAPLREALSFLSLSGLVEARGRQRRYSPTPSLSAEPFPLLLLHHLAAHSDRRQQRS
ncbi:MAG: hypothetical protein HGA45_43670, partial [Chloroflexales bacterium]|nr:hypothetical protein [Chloroflexales bacterium]